LTPTFSRPNGGVVHALCLNAMPCRTPSSASCSAASNAPTADGVPATVPLTPSCATTMLPVSTRASARSASAAAAGSGKGTKR